MSLTATAVQQAQRSTTPTPSFKMNHSQPQSSSSSPSGSNPPSPYYSQQTGDQTTPTQQHFPHSPSQPPNQPFPGQGFPQFGQQAFNQQQQQQFASWAYQQMMFQQQQLAYQPHGPIPPQAAAFMAMTPQQQQQALQMQLIQQQQLAQLTQQSMGMPQPPYAREANGSRTSLSSNQSGSARDSTRQRKTSNKSTASRAGSTAGVAARSASPAPPVPRPRVSSTGSSQRNVNGSTSSSRPGSLSQSTSPITPSSSTTSASGPTRQATKPSPLSQGSYAQVAAGKASSKPRPSPTPSSSPLAPSSAKMSSPPASVPATTSRAQTSNQNQAHAPATAKPGGLKGRLRRALSLSAFEGVEGAEGDDVPKKKPTVQRQPIPPRTPTGEASHQQQPSISSSIPSPVAYVPTEGSIHSTETETAATAPAKKRSLFNSRFNRSTDNMSLSSTVSSASVMIRKLGTVGKLVRRNSLMAISSVFKDKKKDKEGEGADDQPPNADEDKKEKGKKGKDKNKKGAKAEPTAPAASTESENGVGSPNEPSGDEMIGLSPAARVARQHTLRTRAAEAARLKAAAAAASIAETHEPVNTPPAWDKNTTSRKSAAGGPHTWSDDEEDEDSDEDGTFEGHTQPPPQVSDWGNLDDSDEDSSDFGYSENDDTVKINQHRREESVEEPWAVGVRRSVERTRVPAKGILKYAQSFDQNQYLDGTPQAPFTRARSNSNDSAPPMGAEPGPLARIPSPDPDHIDGLHRSNSNSEHGGHHIRKTSQSSISGPTTITMAGEYLPAINFDGSGDASSNLASTLLIGSKDRPLSGSSGTFYANADFNASAPALGGPRTETRANAPPNLRSATVPLTKSKRLTFAANLSVYHTFSPSAYDRRSEPATCNRLTPSLAQRIKEELNSYKMEEMEVHQASRMQ